MSKICITFDCPLVHQFSKNGEGNFDCSKCQKTVHDFTDLNQQSFEQKIPEIQKNQLCGIYRIDQVSDNSKLNWKSKINMNYSSWKKRSRYAIPTLFLGLIIFCTGCRTFTMGGAAHYEKWDPAMKEQQNPLKAGENDSQH